MQAWVPTDGRRRAFVSPRNVLSEGSSHSDALEPDASALQRRRACHLCDWQATLEDKLAYAPGVVYILCALQQPKATAYGRGNHLLTTAPIPDIALCPTPADKLFQDLAVLFKGGTGEQLTDNTVLAARRLFLDTRRRRGSDKDTSAEPAFSWGEPLGSIEYLGGSDPELQRYDCGRCTCYG